MKTLAFLALCVLLGVLVYISLFHAHFTLHL